MKKNIYLSLAFGIGAGTSFILIIIFLSWTAFVTYWHVNPDHQIYSRDLRIGHNPGGLMIFGKQIFSRHSDVWGVTREITETKTGQKIEDQLTFKKILPLSLYLVYLQYPAMLFLLYLSIREFVKVIKSVGAVETFKNSNIQSFRRIGKYQLFFFVLSIVTYVVFKQGNFLKVSIAFTPLLLSLLAFVMAEIFKEGNKLQEENQLTV